MNNFRSAVAILAVSLSTALAGPMARAANLPPDLAITPWITTGLNLPVAVRNAHDGSNRLFIVNLGGRINIATNAGTTVDATPFLNFATNSPLLGFSMTGEGGLLGLAFHPNFASNGYVFVYYTDARLDSVVARYTVMAGNPNQLDPSSQVVLLRVDQDFTNHKAGDIHFGPDGYLYIALGDGGSNATGGDPCRRAQQLDPAQLQGNSSGGTSSAPNDCAADDDFLSASLSPRGNANSRALLGKLLRIDVDHTTPAGANGLCAGSPVDGSANYAIPPSNPFNGGGSTNGCDEIWSYGLRNPFRFSFDRGSGDLFIGDVGQSVKEEHDYQPAGSAGGINYGWSNCEGDVNYRGTCPNGQPPIIVYPHASNDCATTGGYRYRGPIGAINGLYVFGDYCSGNIYYGEQGLGGAWSQHFLTQLKNPTGMMTAATSSVTSFGEDESGNLYLTDITRNRVMKFTSTDPLFTDGLE